MEQAVWIREKEMCLMIGNYFIIDLSFWLVDRS